jgi:hypothetical protein
MFMDLSDTIKENEAMHIEPSLAKYAWPCGVRDVKGSSKIYLQTKVMAIPLHRYG